MNDIFISFLRKYNIYYEDVFNYYENNKTSIDKVYFNNGFIGCYLKLENGILKRVKIVAPSLENYIDVSINIHEYVHMIRLYKNLNKHFCLTKYEEVLPIFYEFLFLYDNLNEECINFLIYYKQCLLLSKNENTIKALNICDELLSEYNKDSIDTLNEKVRKRFI